MATSKPTPKNPNHYYTKTSNISFNFYDQRTSPAPFGYEHFVSLPPSYHSSGQSYPLILFLHGAGESQRQINESFASVRHGIPKIILCYDRMKAGVFPPHIDIPKGMRIRKANRPIPLDMSSEPVSPEVCTLVAENFITVTPSLDMGNGYGWNSSVLSALLDDIVKTYRVDVDRIHVTGFSMGRYGTWALGMHSPSRFATLSPICGGGDTVLARNITHVPQWIHHGDLDNVIPVSQSLKMERALKDAGAQEVKLSRYPTAKHDSWTYAYEDPALFRWMLEHKRVVKGDEIVVPEGNEVDLDEMDQRPADSPLAK